MHITLNVSKWPIIEYDQKVTQIIGVWVSLGQLRQFQLHKLILRESIIETHILCDLAS